MEIFDIDKIDRAIFLALNRVYLKAITEATPSKSGELALNWDIEKIGQLKYLIINSKGDIVTFLEFGTRPHIIRNKVKKALRWKEDNKEHFAKEVHHPGFKARRFVEKTINDSKLFERFKQEVFNILEK